MDISLLAVHKVGHSYNLMVWRVLNYKQVIFRVAQLRWTFVFFILGQYSEMRHQMSGLDYSNEKLVNVLAKRHDLRTVGELYDFLCEHGLPHAADVL